MSYRKLTEEEKAEIANTTNYMQVKTLIDKMDKGGKKRVADALKKSLGMISESKEQIQQNLQQLQQQQYNLEAVINQVRQTTKAIKHDDTIHGIMNGIKQLAQKAGIDASELRYAENQVLDAFNELESAVYGLEEAFTDKLRDVQNQVEDLEYELENPDELDEVAKNSHGHTRKQQAAIAMAKQGVAEGFPQPGPSSGAPKQFGSDAKIQTRQMTVKDIISSVPGVPYYNNVVDDWDAKDYSWGVTKKVIEYATYLKDHPESLAKLPPAIVLNGKFEDGAHRVSAIWLLQQRMDPKNPLWKNAKLNVQFVKQGVAEGSLEEVDRRGFLKGLGAAAVGAGATGVANGQQFTNQDERDKNTIEIAKTAAQCSAYYFLAYEISKNEKFANKGAKLSQIAGKYLGQQIADKIQDELIYREYSLYTKSPNQYIEQSLKPVIVSCDKLYASLIKAMNTSRSTMESVKQGVAEGAQVDGNRPAKVLAKNLKKLTNIDYDTVDRLMKAISKKYNLSNDGKDLHVMFAKLYGHNPDYWVRKQKGLAEGEHDAEFIDHEDSFYNMVDFAHKEMRKGKSLEDIIKYLVDNNYLGFMEVNTFIKQMRGEKWNESVAEADSKHPGLWANIHAKRERIKHGSHEHMRKPGSKGAPTAQAFKDSAKTSKNESSIMSGVKNVSR